MMYVAMYTNGDDGPKADLHRSAPGPAVEGTRASQYRVTEAELIRRAIDGTIQAGAQAVDPGAWTDIERYIADRKRRVKARKTPRWSRESLHDR